MMIRRPELVVDVLEKQEPSHHVLQVLILYELSPLSSECSLQPREAVNSSLAGRMAWVEMMGPGRRAILNCFTRLTP